MFRLASELQVVPSSGEAAVKCLFEGHDKAAIAKFGHAIVAGMKAALQKLDYIFSVQLRC